VNGQIAVKKPLLLELLRKHGVKRASLFGSTVTGAATEDSDIDFLVEFEGDKTLLDLAGLRIDLQELLGKKVDVLTFRSLHQLLRERILSEQEVLL
jgi:predicted nucleotidyltransferase